MFLEATSIFDNIIAIQLAVLLRRSTVLSNLILKVCRKPLAVGKNKSLLCNQIPSLKSEFLTGGKY